MVLMISLMDFIRAVRVLGPILVGFTPQSEIPLMSLINQSD